MNNLTAVQTTIRLPGYQPAARRRSPATDLTSLNAPALWENSSAVVSVYQCDPVRLLDLRTAASCDARERHVADLLTQLREMAESGQTIELIWPRDNDAARAATYLGAPLAMQVADALTGTRGRMVIHTRAGAMNDFVLLPPHPNIRFIVHLNSEVAAMRWERNEAAPARRLAAAAHLRNAGWQVHICVGDVRMFDGWREEYEDLTERLEAAGFLRLLASFPDEGIFKQDIPGDVDGLDPVAAGNGYIFSLSVKHRREVLRYLERCMGHPKPGARSGQTAPHGSRNRRPFFGVRSPKL